MPALLFAEPSYNGKTQSHWLRALNHPAAMERAAAITALMNLMSQGRVNPSVLTALRQATEDEDARVRLAATEALGNFGVDRGLAARNASSPTSTMSALAKRLEDENANVRDAAVTALAKQGRASRQQLLPILAPILSRGTPNARRGALLVLAQLGDDVQLSEELRISVLRSARDPDAAIRRAALRALAITPPRPDAAQLLLGMFSSNDEEIQKTPPTP
ncbi:MAG: sister chromatid cohesion protein PDS5 [Planctomycetota bacterium]